MNGSTKRLFAFLVPSIAVLALTAASACAQTTAPAAKSHKAANTSMTTVAVTNSRSVALTELDATPTGGYLPKAIARNVAAGKKASVSVATDKDCVFDLHGIYADGSSTDSTSVDLCKDKNVNLVN